MEIEQGVLVGDLHDRHGRVVDVWQPRVGIPVGEELFGELLLKLDHPVVEAACPLDRVVPAVLQLRGVFHAVGFHEPAVVEHVEIDVDAAFLQLGEEEVEPVEHLLVEVAAIAPRVVD